MPPPGYPAWVKTIEAIRMANFKRLAEELRERDGLSSDKAVADAMGISGAYMSQLGKGVRGAINSVAARKIERKAQKPEGWMDTDFDLWPFPDVELLERVERLLPNQRIEVQGAMRRAIADFEAKPVLGKSSSSQDDAPQRGVG